MMRAEILSYSRARGVFAGISLDGSTLRPDHADNRELYGHDVSQREILTGAVKAPAIADSLPAIQEPPRITRRLQSPVIHAEPSVGAPL